MPRRVQHHLIVLASQPRIQHRVQIPVPDPLYAPGRVRVILMGQPQRVHHRVIARQRPQRVPVRVPLVVQQFPRALSTAVRSVT